MPYFFYPNTHIAHKSGMHHLSPPLSQSQYLFIFAPAELTFASVKGRNHPL